MIDWDPCIKKGVNYLSCIEGKGALKIYLCFIILRGNCFSSIKSLLLNPSLISLGQENEHHKKFSRCRHVNVNGILWWYSRRKQYWCSQYSKRKLWWHQIIHSLNIVIALLDSTLLLLESYRFLSSLLHFCY